MNPTNVFRMLENLPKVSIPEKVLLNHTNDA
jgi:hypothetical protein